MNGKGKHKEKEIELRSQEIQEILSRPPRTLVRWGITVFFVIIALLFIGGCFFQYPDVVSGEVTVTTERPPVWLVSRSTGKIQEIFLPDRYRIRKGDIIAAAENPASTADVLQLKEALLDFTLSDSIICGSSFPAHWTLGEVQSIFNTFIKNQISYKDFIMLDLYGQKEEAAKKELNEYRTYIGHLNKQAALNKEEIEIAENSYIREKNLFSRKVTSEADYEAARQMYLARKQSSEQLMVTLSSARIQEAKLEQNIIEIQLERNREANNLSTALKAAYDELWVEIGKWELTYLFVSPAEGILSYHNLWQENQELKAGDKAFSIVAAQTGNIIGKIKLPASGHGKVGEGQRVNISITGYPQMEYGYLTGKITSVSLLADENMYIASVELPQNLVTSYKKTLAFTGELTGVAEIMTNERSLTLRLLEPLRYIWEKHFS